MMCCKNKASMIFHALGGLVLLYGAFMFSWEVALFAVILMVVGCLIGYFTGVKSNVKMINMPKPAKRKKRR